MIILNTKIDTVETVFNVADMDGDRLDMVIKMDTYNGSLPLLSEDGATLTIKRWVKTEEVQTIERRYERTYFCTPKGYRIN